MDSTKGAGKITRKNPNFIMMFSIFVLLLFGLLMVFSSSSLGSSGGSGGGDLFYYFFRQLRWAGLGLVVFFLAMNIPLTWVRRWTPLFVLLVIASLLAVLFIGIGEAEHGASRWLYVGPIRFQPSELAKLALVFLFAGLFSSWKEKLRLFFPHYLTALAILLFFSFLILIEPDLSTTVVVASTGFFLLFVAGAKIWHLLLTGLGGVGALLFAVSQSSYQMRRWEIFKDPMLEPLDGGYQIIQGLYAIGSGGLGGVGLGNSRQIYWVPQQHTDFIFAILGEELGFLGTMTVLAMFMVFIFSGFHIAKKAPTAYMSYLAFGLTFFIGVQGLINVAVVTNLVPTTGITLPFISYGGTSLVMTLLASGLILNISRYTKESS